LIASSSAAPVNIFSAIKQIKEVGDKSKGGVEKGKEYLEAIAPGQNICDSINQLANLAGIVSTAADAFSKLAAGGAVISTAAGRLDVAAGFTLVITISNYISGTFDVYQQTLDTARGRAGSSGAACPPDGVPQDPKGGAITNPPISPLIIDLNGDGVKTIPLETSQTYFDLDGDGFAQRAGWASVQDGLLALDRNGNGHHASK
jgi:hypothetical protein